MSEQSEETPIQEDRTTRPPNPARGPGYLWLFHSGLSLAVGTWHLLSISSDPNLEEQQKGLGLIAWGFALIPIGILACAILWAGIRTTFGMAPDTLGNGTGSIGFGGLLTYYAWKGWAKRGFEEVEMFLSVSALILLIAGVWALLVRQKYLLWKARS